MVLVCIAHFGEVYFGPAKATTAQFVTTVIGRGATPTFVLLSGLLLGFLSVQLGNEFDRFSWKFIDRGIFLLGPGHFAILAAFHWVRLGIGKDVEWFFVTDALGVCLIIGPWLVRHISPGWRCVIGLMLFTGAWWGYLQWTPGSHSGQFVKKIALGVDSPTVGGAVFPVIPWLSVYVVGSVLGERLANLRQQKWSPTPMLFGLTAVCGVLAVGLELLHFHRGFVVGHLFNIMQKYPPGPAYLMAGTSVGLAALAITARFEQKALAKNSLRTLAFVGQNSLIVFIIQYYVFLVGSHLFKLPVGPWWPTYFLAAIGLIYAGAWGWARYFGNDYLTVGLTWLIHRRHALDSESRA